MKNIAMEQYRWRDGTITHMFFHFAPWALVA